MNKTILISLMVFLVVLPLALAIPYSTEKIEEKWGNAIGNHTFHMEIPFISLGFSNVEIRLQSLNESTRNIKNFEIKLARSVIPDDYQLFDGVWHNVVEANWSVGSPAEIESLIFTFRVPYEWMDENNLTTDDVSLYRYISANELEELETEYVEDFDTTSRGTFALFDATTTNLSLLVVGESNALLLADTGDDEEETEETNETEEESVEMNETEETEENETVEVVAAECNETWECGEWSDCVEGTRTRDCVDANDCGTEDGKPAIEQECEVVVEETAIMDKPLTKGVLYGVGAVVALAIIIVVVAFGFRKTKDWHKQKKLDKQFDKRVEDMNQQQERNLPGMPPESEPPKE